MNFFNIDSHISVIQDIIYIFNQLGHKIDTRSISDHSWLFNYKKWECDIVSKYNWKNINENTVDKFYLKYKNTFDKYDGFICTYNTLFVKLFEKFNKPIIVVVATRYDNFLLDDENRLKWLEDSLNNNPNIIRLTNNWFDKKYCENFLSTEWNVIPSLCKYTNATHVNKHSKSILFSKFNINLENILHYKKLGNYKWEDLYEYQNIVHLPYNVSTMSIFEQHSANIPLIFPSIDFILNSFNKIPFLNEMILPSSNLKRNIKLFFTREWLEKCDFYNNTIKCEYFSNYQELQYLTKNYIQTNNYNNKDLIFNKWETVLNNF